MLEAIWRYIFVKAQIEFECNSWGCEFDLEMHPCPLPRLNIFKRWRYIRMSNNLVNTHNFQCMHFAKIVIRKRSVQND